MTSDRVVLEGCPEWDITWTAGVGPITSRRGPDRCWQCDEFPCDKGMYGQEEWRGLGIGSVECIKEHGLERYVAILRSRFGDVVEFEPYRSKSPRQVKASVVA